MKFTTHIVLLLIAFFTLGLVQKTQSLTIYFGNPSAIQKLVLQAVQSGFTETKFLIDRQFWFMLIGAQYDKYTFKIKAQLIQYKVNYTSPGNIFVFDINFNKTSWRPQLNGNRTYKVPIIAPDSVPEPVIAPISIVNDDKKPQQPNRTTPNDTKITIEQNNKNTTNTTALTNTPQSNGTQKNTTSQKDITPKIQIKNNLTTQQTVPPQANQQNQQNQPLISSSQQKKSQIVPQENSASSNLIN